jgi:peroxiredoxin
MLVDTTATERRRRSLRWIGALLPLAGIGVLILANALSPPPPPAGVGVPAPDLALPDTHGGTVTLARALDEAEAGVLLYFSMGVGCGGCFAQIPEVSDALTARGIQLVPIVVDDAELVRVEAERYGATGPIALDADRRVSEAYGMLGVGGHGDRPSHSFALVAADGTIADVVHYAEMFVPVDRLLVDLGLDVAASPGPPS